MIVAGFKNGVRWDEWVGPYARCALKILKLAVGTLETREVLGREPPVEPSWATTPASPAANDDSTRKIVASRPTQDSSLHSFNRSNRTRPWREAKCLRQFHWEKAGPEPVLECTPIKLPPATKKAPTPSERKICIDVPPVGRTRWSSPPEFITKNRRTPVLAGHKVTFSSQPFDKGEKAVRGSRINSRHESEGSLSGDESPCSELYGDWIPQQSFHGKALVPSRHWKGAEQTMESVPPTVVAGANDVRDGAIFLEPMPSHRGHKIYPASRRSSLGDAKDMEAFTEESDTAEESLSCLTLKDAARKTDPTQKEANANCAGCASKRSDEGPFLGPVPPADFPVNDGEHFDYTKQFSWHAVAGLCSAGYATGNEGLSQEEWTAATERARERSNHAARAAVERLRAPQCVFSPLHRAPSRPEMRRSITHGRFSPLGRKLWRRSEGLCPRVGQLRLQAAPPPGRFLSPALECGE